jgi:multimeric flavodoxin WrbA
MSKLAIVYHSAHGHTEFIARQVQVGTSDVEGVDADLVRAEDIARTPDELVGYDGFIFGSPTYLGGVSGTFKSFMDATGRHPTVPACRCRSGA